jgi:hypothetical protein
LSSATFLTFFGAVVGAVITATYQLVSLFSARQERRADRAIELQKLRREAYESYLAAYNQYASLYDDYPPADNDAQVMDARNEYWRAYRGLFHIAPDEVLLAATEFHKLAFTSTDVTEEAYIEKFRDLYATMLGEMRNDAFGQTFLSKTMIEERLPIYIPPASSETREDGY